MATSSTVVRRSSGASRVPVADDDCIRLREPLSAIAAGDDLVRIYEFGEPYVHLRGPVDTIVRWLRALDGSRDLSEAAVVAGADPVAMRTLAEKLLEQRVLIRERQSPEKEDDRYDRQLRYMARYWADSSDLQTATELLHRCHVTMIGIGGAGAFAAHSLVAAGIGCLRIVDPDRVELSNLNRHPLVTVADIGRLKGEVCAERLSALNPNVAFEIKPRLVTTSADALELMASTDIMVCSADAPPVVLRREINRACLRAGVATLFFGAWRIGPFVIPGETACWACAEQQVRSHEPLWDAMVDGFRMPRRPPSIVSVPAISGTMAAYEIIKQITGILPAASRGKIVAIDPASLMTSVVDIGGSCSHLESAL